MPNTIFGKIVRGETEADVVYRDDLVTAFRDINPQAPTHVLIVPNEAVASVAEVEERHEAALGRMFTVARRIAEEEGIAEDGYRLIVNTLDYAGQEVYHLHVHLLGGRPLGPMLAR
jgi:histidine triad (HIT) family protein